ncbi:MAG TPA: hypothetical protein VD860_01840, partial [Azospirillum sp.]|nr:hypothetical protein [Azospirillum sp.]
MTQPDAPALSPEDRWKTLCGGRNPRGANIMAEQFEAAIREAEAAAEARGAAAARRDALEEAAKVAEDMEDNRDRADSRWDGGAGMSGYSLACSD